MASAEGKVWTPPVDPETTDRPFTVNSLFTVRLPFIESWLALMLVASPPEETPAVRDNRLRILRFGSGRFWTCEGLMVVPSEELSVASCPAVWPATVTGSANAPGCRVVLIAAL